MSLPEQGDDDAVVPESNESIEEAAALFQGDRGHLTLETRRVLVQLLLGPALDGRRQTKLWPILLRDEVIIHSRLSELFLTLVIDRDQQVAFTRQADVGDLEAPVLLRRSPLTFIDSVLLIFLRQVLTQADMRGERAAVDTSEIVEHLITYERASNTDHAGFVKKVQSSIEKMKTNSILHKIRGVDERYEISPTLKILFSPDEIQAMSRQYHALLDGATGRLAADPDQDEETD